MNIRSWSSSVGVAVAALLLLLSLPDILPAQVQASTGLIRGVVSDSLGRPMEGAIITLRNRETNATRTHSTNRRGVFVASLLRVGSYDVQARAIGFGSASRNGVAVNLGQAAVVDFRLTQAATQLAEINVRGVNQLVEQTRVAAATRIDTAIVQGIPNNGRNFLNFALLTPNTAIVQGPDGDELSVGGQRGIHNNVSVDGADFNNPFFGEQRGGQRPAFTFNLDAVQEMVVVGQGATPEFGRSGGGFVNVITKSGTNQLHGTAHYFGKYNPLSADYSTTSPAGVKSGFAPDFSQTQFGFTLGGPIVKDKAFFFVAYDQQLFKSVKQKDRTSLIDPALLAWVNTAYGGALKNDFSQVSRTNDANALMAKLDFRLGSKHNASLKYNYTNSRQENGTFDVDIWGRSANGIERDFSHAINGSLVSQLSSSSANEFRFQVSREDRPRSYEGPDNPTTGRPFPDTDISFTGFRIGMPFFLPITAHDTRFQVLDNMSWVRGSHLIKAGVEYNRTAATQTFVGFGNGRMAFSSVNGFLNYANFGNGYVECSNGTSSTTGACPSGSSITGPVVLYLQAAGVNGLSVEEAGTQTIVQQEIAVFLQDSWKPSSTLTLDYGLRWEAQFQPDVITPADKVFFAPFIGTSVTNAKGTFAFPSDGNIPSYSKMIQPRVGLAWDVKGDARQLVRASAGIYYARIPGLNLAGTRSTNGSRAQNLFRNSSLIPVLGRPPAFGELLPSPSSGPFQPGVTVVDKDFQNPRTLSASVSFEQAVADAVALTFDYTFAKTDHLTRFVDRNDAVFGSPWATGLPGGNGLGGLTTVESSAKSQYHGFTVGLKGAPSRKLQYQLNYTLSFDKADDDNERDPFSFRYVSAANLTPEYNWSDRDQRHRINAWLLAQIPGNIYLNNRVSYFSAQPTSEKCINNAPSGQRASLPSDRLCANGTILLRNTIRKDNAYLSWDLRLSKMIAVGKNKLEAVVEVFNVTNSDNFRDPSSGGLFLNFDGTIRSGLGEPRQAQAGLRYIF